MSVSWRDLTSPRRARWPAASGAVARPRLRALLGASPVLVVVAPAGYGKTTALAATGPDTDSARAWLTLDADDADPQVLAAGLALAVEGLPGGAAPGALLDAGASPRRVAARVADVLDGARARLVLDEAQHLLTPLVEGVLREVLDCGAGRVTLLSRVPLPLPDLTRLEAAGVVTRLSAADLGFTPDEVGAVLRAQGLTPGNAEVRQAHALTEGWPIAARFLAHSVAQGRVGLRALADLDGGEAQLGTLFAYLAQEVLGPLEPALRNVLTRGSVFEELTADLLEDVLEEPHAGALLEALARSGTFLTRTGPVEGGGGAYRAHPLLRAHLRSALPAGEATRVAARGAAYFERTGRPRRAMAAHLLAGNAGRAAQLLAAHGDTWLSQGRVTLVERSLHRLPPDAWTPDLHALAGDALRLSSRYDGALAAYARATPLRRALGEVQVALDTVQPDEAWAPLDVAEALLTGSGDGAALVGLRRLRAENLLNAGQPGPAVALEPALAGGARHALRTGDLNRALALAQDAARGETGGARAAQNHREGLLLASFLHAICGDAPAAVRAAGEGLAEGERLDSPFVRALALARLGHAHLSAGDDPAARAAYDRALELAQGVVPRLRVEPLMGHAFLTARAGDPLRARTLRDDALARTGGDGYMRGLVHLAAGLGSIQAGDAAGTADDLDAARDAFTACGDAFGLAAVALATFAAHGHGAPEAVQGAARYPFLLTTGAMFAPLRSRAARARLLATLAEARPHERAALASVAAALGYADVPASADTPGFGVHVHVLERVQVVREHESQPREWGRAKARDLLALLAVHRAGLPREAAQEALFPDAEPGVGERNFRVTLHALGQVLEDGAASGVFVERGEWLRLRPGPDLYVDLWAAWDILAMPAGTPGRLPALAQLGARVAPSDLRDVQREAERYAAALPDALATEAGVALEAGDPDGAAVAAERALILDPAHEPAARAAMRAHHARGHPAAARRVYAGLRGALCELDLSPLPETVALRQALGGPDGAGG
ncbi:DNA-binding SARP family transcriptional activator [Deinococcus metalli]|uniref:Transcriptional activator n=1 Tax=Deinococcus metalli TaxID=1141878 RepID=A0A7W8KID3_9DEIO|nr:BTAD domain-containing putative transcriptional regulator [Deinococcus metalli]MBB5377054.1 DNA-binding SARP family transcriptional activator [Deinococcus metalli]GHF49285.1 transcriptional activator [Deinococcus metalli]